MKMLFDLRFVIGVFFLVIGTLLIFFHFVGATNLLMSITINIGVAHYTLFLVLLCFFFRIPVTDQKTEVSQRKIDRISFDYHETEHYKIRNRQMKRISPHSGFLDFGLLADFNLKRTITCITDGKDYLSPLNDKEPTINYFF